MPSENQAVYLDGKDAKLRIGTAPYPEPGADEVIIRVKALAINPVDWKIQDHGIFIQNWPAVLGEDVAGEIVAVGSGNQAYGGFQLYVRGPAATTGHLPDHISFAQSSVLPLAIGTAAGGLYAPREAGGMGLPFPSAESAATTGQKTLLVWGGSSSVGAVAIQLARQSGARVIATASARNLQFCRDAGATNVFDYSTADVVDQLIKDIHAHGGATAFLGVCDAISTPDSYAPVIKLLQGLGPDVEASLATTLPPPKAEELPKSVKTNNVFGVNDLSHTLWKDYFTIALQKGLLKPLPPPEVVGDGLESIQHAMDVQKKGVSAKKIVIEL